MVIFGAAVKNQLLFGIEIERNRDSRFNIWIEPSWPTVARRFANLELSRDRECTFSRENALAWKMQRSATLTCAIARSPVLLHIWSRARARKRFVTLIPSISAFKRGTQNRWNATRLKRTISSAESRGRNEERSYCRTHVGVHFEVTWRSILGIFDADWFRLISICVSALLVISQKQFTSLRRQVFWQFASKAMHIKNNLFTSKQKHTENPHTRSFLVKPVALKTRGNLTILYPR